MARRSVGPAGLAVVGAVRDTLERAGEGPAPAVASVVVACSGGADSLALAAGTAQVAALRARHGSVLSIAAVVVDHGLQPTSATAAGETADRLAMLGYGDVVVRRVGVCAAGNGPEAAARTARYAVLDSEAEARSALVLLGHTLDDQAETVLLGLARGSGTRSLAGMPAREDRRLRPLLGLRRRVTEAYCAELGLTPWHDPQNVDARFTRARVRQRVLPVLEAELGPGVAEALARTAQLARDDADLLDVLAAQASPTDELTGGSGPDCAALAALAPAVRRRVLRTWLSGRTSEPSTMTQVLAVEELALSWRGQHGVDLPGATVRRRDGHLTVERGLSSPDRA